MKRFCPTNIYIFLIIPKIMKQKQKEILERLKSKLEWVKFFSNTLKEELKDNRKIEAWFLWIGEYYNNMRDFTDDVVFAKIPEEKIKKLIEEFKKIEFDTLDWAKDELNRRIDMGMKFERSRLIVKEMLDLP